MELLLKISDFDSMIARRVEQQLEASIDRSWKDR
jgi:hypothetical protein